MPVAQIIDFKRTGGGGSSRPRGWMGRHTIHIPLFDAINRQNEQPTMKNIIFGSFYTIPTIKCWKFNNMFLAQNLEKRQGVPPRFFFQFLAQIFLWDLYVLTIGSNWGTLKKVRNDVNCLIMSTLNESGKGEVRGREVGGNGREIYVSLFDEINRRNEQTTTVNIILSPP